VVVPGQNGSFVSGAIVSGTRLLVSQNHLDAAVNVLPVEICRLQ
jgi:hypothetical protein